MKTQTKQFALCIDNTDYEESLIRGKAYRILPDPKAARQDLVRVVDESDEDNLYHKKHFQFVDSPPPVTKKIAAMGGSSAEPPDPGRRQSGGSAGKG